MNSTNMEFESLENNHKPEQAVNSKIVCMAHELIRSPPGIPVDDFYNRSLQIIEDRGGDIKPDDIQQVIDSLTVEGKNYDLIGPLVSILMKLCPSQELAIDVTNLGAVPYLCWKLQKKRVSVLGDVSNRFGFHALQCVFTAGNYGMDAGRTAHNSEFYGNYFDSGAGESSVGCKFYGRTFDTHCGGYSLNSEFYGDSFEEISSCQDGSSSYFLKGQKIDYEIDLDLFDT